MSQNEIQTEKQKENQPDSKEQNIINNEINKQQNDYSEQLKEDIEQENDQQNNQKDQNDQSDSEQSIENQNDDDNNNNVNNNNSSIKNKSNNNYNSTEQDKQNENQDDTMQQSNVKQKRRTRNDQSDRNYTCGCGKSYLSYPALYTHLKQKHNNQTPEGTSIPTNPVKQLQKNKIKEDGGSLADLPQDDIQQYNNPYDQDVIDDLLVFLDTLGKNYRIQNNERNLNITEIVSTQLFEEYEESLNFQQIYQYLEQVQQNRQKEQQISNIENSTNQNTEMQEFINQNVDYQINKEKDIKLVILDKVFAYFIYDVSQKLNKAALKEIILFCCLFRKSLNQHGYLSIQDEAVLTSYSPLFDEYYQKIQQYDEEEQQYSQMENEDGNSTIVNQEKQEEIKQIQKTKPIFCQQPFADYAALISNDFIIELFSQYWKQDNYEKYNTEFTILGTTEVKLKNLVFVVSHFSDWLFVNKFSNTKLVFKLDTLQDEMFNNNNNANNTNINNNSNIKNYNTDKKSSLDMQSDENIQNSNINEDNKQNDFNQNTNNIIPQKIEFENNQEGSEQNIIKTEGINGNQPQTKSEI